MQHGAAMLSMAVVALIGAALVGSILTADAQGVGPTEETVDTSSTEPVPTPPTSWLPASSPQLACGVRPGRSGVPGASLATFTCWVAGAPDGDTRFTLQAVRIVDEQGGTRPIGVVCGEGTLLNGAGACTGSLVDSSGGPMVGGLQISGTLLPSGTPLGPVQIAPTLAGT